MNPARRTPSQRKLGILDYLTTRALLTSGATYDQVATAALVSRKTVESYTRRTGLSVGKHLRGKRSRINRATKVKL